MNKKEKQGWILTIVGASAVGGSQVEGLAAFGAALLTIGVGLMIRSYHLLFIKK